MPLKPRVRGGNAPQSAGPDHASTGNPVAIPAGHDMSSGDISKCPFFSGEAKSENQSQIPAFMKSFINTKAGPDGKPAEMPDFVKALIESRKAQGKSTEVPAFMKGMLGQGGDISKCPVFNPQAKEACSESNQVSTSVTEKKGKCPIPFHNQLAVLTQRWFWIYVAVLVIAVTLARIL